MKAYDYVEKLINECNENQDDFGERLKNSLVRLTKNFSPLDQEKLITKIIKGEIFSYIFVPEIPGKYPQEWLALRPSQANTIIQNPREKITISLGERYGAADIDCLWVVEEEADSHLKTGPSRTTNIIVNPPLDTTNVKRKNKPFKHPEFELFIRAIKKQGYSTFMRNLEDCGCQFEKEIDYIKHVQSSLIVKEKSKYKTDSSSEYVKDVAIIRRATYKNESEKEVVVYRLTEEISNVESSSKIKEHRKVPFRTIQDYFSS